MSKIFLMTYVFQMMLILFLHNVESNRRELNKQYRYIVRSLNQICTRTYTYYHPEAYLNILFSPQNVYLLKIAIICAQIASIKISGNDCNFSVIPQISVMLYSDTAAKVLRNRISENRYQP